MAFHRPPKPVAEHGLTSLPPLQPTVRSNSTCISSPRGDSTRKLRSPSRSGAGGSEVDFMGEDDGDTAGDLSSTRSALSLSARGEEEVCSCDGQHVRQHRRAPVEHRDHGVHGAPPPPRRWT